MTPVRKNIIIFGILLFCSSCCFVTGVITPTILRDNSSLRDDSRPRFLASFGGPLPGYTACIENMDYSKPNSHPYSHSCPSPDGQYLATITGRSSGLINPESKVSIWNIATDELIQEIIHPSDRGMRVSWSPDGTRIVSTAYDIRVWDVASGDEVLHLSPVYIFGPYDAKYSSNGRYIVTAGEPDLIIWDAETGTRLQDFGDCFDCEKIYREIEFSPDGHLLFARLYDDAFEEDRSEIWHLPEYMWQDE